jgi:hypothetical protein
MKITMAFASYETLGFESWLYNLPILTVWHIIGLFSIHLISIEFQNIDNDQGNPPKKVFSPPSIVIIYQSWGHFDWDFFYNLLA